MLKVFADIDRLDVSEKILSRLETRAIVPNTACVTAILASVRREFESRPQELDHQLSNWVDRLQKMGCKLDLASFNYMIDLFSKLSMMKEVENWVAKMQEQDVVADVHTYT